MKKILDEGKFYQCRCYMDKGLYAALCSKMSQRILELNRPLTIQEVIREAIEQYVKPKHGGPPMTLQECADAEAVPQ